MTDLADKLIAQAVAPAPQSASAPAPLDYWQLQEVNKEVNRGPYRDCEWFTHFKQQKLKEMGIPSEKVFVSTTGGEQPDHVIVKAGDYYLDNRYKRVMTEKELRRGRYRIFPGYEIPLPPPRMPGEQP